MQYFRPQYKQDMRELFEGGYKPTKADAEASARCGAQYGARWLTGATGGLLASLALLRMRGRLGERAQTMIEKFRPFTVALVATLAGGYVSGLSHRGQCFEVFLAVDSPLGEVLRKRAKELDPELLRKVQVVRTSEQNDNGSDLEHTYPSRPRFDDEDDSGEKVYAYGGTSVPTSRDPYDYSRSGQGRDGPDRYGQRRRDNEEEEEDPLPYRRYFDAEDDDAKEPRGFDQRRVRRGGRDAFEDPRARSGYYDYGRGGGNRDDDRRYDYGDRSERRGF